MRYSRTSAKQPKKKRKYTNLIIVVVILGVSAYLIGAGVAGEWLAQNLINPVFNNEGTSAADSSSVDSILPSENNVPDTPQATVQTVSLPETSGTRMEAQITAKEIALFALQTGAFSEEVNAKDAASEIISKGGAGFVAFDGDYYRVLIAGYTDENDANDVKGSLGQQDISTSIFNLKSGSLEFKIGAEQSQIDAVKACFDIVPESVDTLQNMIFNADKGEAIDAAMEALQQKVTEVSDNLNGLVSSDSGAMLSLNTYMKGFCETINNIPKSSVVSGVEFSSQLKYNLISIVVDYSSFLDEISS